ncbi:MAG TPA: potassium transporter TrkG [Lachnospiraceae bacterium]|nr:potassium transporter TrkG [Lachnospiraceae bacterium]
MIENKKKTEWSTTQMIIFGFLSAILVGTFMLCLPFASASGKATPIIDALFTATTSVCVTGLVIVNTFEYWSVFGQVIILLLIQFGGLGIVTFTTSLMLIIGRKVTLKDRLLIEDAFNLNTLSGLIRFLRKILFGTFIIEGTGAIFYMFTFIPEFGITRGIWISIFNSISAFCNAGIDIIGPDSLMPYVTNPWINLVTMSLIILGGIGFIVWWDVLRVLKLYKQKEILRNKIMNKLNLHSKIVITTTFFLIVGGALLIFLLEFDNPATIGHLSGGNKLIASFFESVTTRTAGFLTVSQKGLKDSTVVVCMLLMFIGGSPVGSAGGIKTTTIALVFLSALATINGHEEVTAYKRTIPLRTVRKAVSVTVIFLVCLMVLTILLSIVVKGSFMDIAFETVSAMGTVGLSRDFTTSLNFTGKVIIIICMYLGRIGPISLAIAFSFKQGKRSLRSYAKEDITVG